MSGAVKSPLAQWAFIMNPVGPVTEVRPMPAELWAAHGGSTYVDGDPLPATYEPDSTPTSITARTANDYQPAPNTAAVSKKAMRVFLTIGDGDEAAEQELQEELQGLIDIGEPAVAPLIEALRDEDGGVRVFAAFVLGGIGDPRAVEPLIQALSDENIDVRECAAWALGANRDERAVEPLIVAALRDGSKDVRLLAAWAIDEIYNEPADVACVLDRVLDVLQESSESEKKHILEAGVVRQLLSSVPLERYPDYAARLIEVTVNNEFLFYFECAEVLCGTFPEGYAIDRDKSKLLASEFSGVVKNAIRKDADDLSTDRFRRIYIRWFYSEMLGRLLATRATPRLVKKFAAWTDEDWWIEKLMRKAFPRLNHHEQVRLILDVGGHLKPAPVAQALTEKLTVKQRIQLVQDAIRLSRGLESVSDDVLHLLSRIVPLHALQGFARRHGDENLREMVLYRAAGLPPDSYLWRQFLAADDPEGYLQRTVADIAPYRRGRHFLAKDGHELHLAYAGLDSPEGLSFHQFASSVSSKKPPPPFLGRSFSTRVRMQRSTHAVMDKSVVAAALEPLNWIRSKGMFEAYLRRNRRQLRSVRDEREKYFPHDHLLDPEFDLLSSVRGLLSAVWDKRQNPNVRKLIMQMAILIAWHERTKQQSRERWMEISYEPGISSVELYDGLKGLEEFYRNAVEDVLQKELGGSGAEFRFIREQQKRLARELENVAVVPQSDAEVEFIPSKNAADRFFGYMAEDCNKDQGDAIDRDDFQIYRMVSSGRLVGVVYLQRAMIDGMNALVTGIQPRTSWKVDQEDLLGVIEENISHIAREEKYDAVLLMGAPNQQSNRTDVQHAIKERGYRKLHTSDRVSGAVFEGDKFLIMWERQKK